MQVIIINGWPGFVDSHYLLISLEQNNDISFKVQVKLEYGTSWLPY